MKIEADQTSDVDLQAWEHFTQKWDNQESSDLCESCNIINYTFDKNKFGGN